MKLISFFCIALSLISTPVFAQEDFTAQEKSSILRGLFSQSPDLRRWALSEMFNARCKRYYRHYKCAQFTKNLVTQLDQDVIKVNNQRPRNSNPNWGEGGLIIVAFKTELIKLMKQRKTSRFLNEVKESLSKSLLNLSPTESFSKIMTKYGATFEESASLPAVLFQDTSESRLHLLYLQRLNLRDPVFLENLILLEETLSQISFSKEMNKQKFNNFFYPTSQSNILNGNIYHFYVPAYLSLKLLKLIPSHAALKLPLYMTASYEFISDSHEGYNYNYLFKDPQTVKNDWKIKDILSSHLGSHWGLGQSQKSLSYNILRSEFYSSTQKAMFLLSR